MKKTKKLLPLVVLITLSQAASALELPVVSKYSEAEQAQIWVKAKADQVPAALMGNEVVGDPTYAYSKTFPKSFLQESMFVVCYQDCNNKDTLKLKNGEISNKDDWNVIEQANVYFWVNRYFDFVESKLNFRLDKHLRVMTNRDVREDGKKLTNNAFFNPQDTTLSFLPANKNLLFKLMAGKINRSGFDPSVIAHEASHYLFQHLYPNAVNDEISGLNEGFADYIANIFLDNPKIGMVMLQGKPLRDASSMVASNRTPKVYSPGMEVHDLGERVSYALWETRKLTQNKEEYDRLVIDAVLDLNKNPYNAVHDFKEKMLARIETLLDSSAMSEARATWNLSLEGKAIKLANTNFLSSSIPSQSYIGFKVRETLTEEMAKTYGVARVHENNFSLLKTVKISDTQFAILAAKESEDVSTPYWIALDAERGNYLGFYSLDKKLVTDHKETEEVSRLAKMAAQSSSLAQDFVSKLVNFVQLKDNKGQLAMAYKLKSLTEKDATLTFNGERLSGKAVEMEVKRKMLVAILGVPAVDKITLYTVPTLIDSLPQLNGQTVIGYKLQLPDGTETEMSLDKYVSKK
ncbi:gluzincin family metallopeptidase [Peredibacter starrii]|uniref:Uncharacterized protein n=1 Tax=Peredibacter starrii TaxID=28202 RepID=A0AAX4HUM1_9BACT|nr:hypothetical protein [Peredibacter starrii]WPU66952.1 hypothetical protein SOO65_09335 [Peredibacter starrii]